MPQNNPLSSGTDNIPTPSYKPSQQLITAIPGIPTTQAKEQAAKLLDGARYLNHTGVMLGDHCALASIRFRINTNASNLHGKAITGWSS